MTTTTLQVHRYKVIETLGTGASSRVDKARDSVIGRTVALKTFITGFVEDGEQQFLREAQIVGQLSDPSIVQLYDVGTDEQGTAYLVMEYVAGNTLAHYLTQSPVPVQRACAWAADLANALDKAHRAGIIHGDVKPANIFVTAENKVKLGDFGIARFATQISGSGRVMGTPAYLSPEQIKGEKQDQRSDIFSLGIVLYEMVTGVRPFAGTSLPAVCAQILEATPLPPSKCNAEFPKVLDRIIARCLAKNPDNRYKSGEELARDLYVLARAKKTTAPAPAKSNWMARPLQPRDVWAAGVMLFLVITGATVTHALQGRSKIESLPVFVAAAPPVPAELLTYSQQANASPEKLSKVSQSVTKHPPARNFKPAAPALPAILAQTVPTVPITVPIISAPTNLTVEHAGLQIAITSAASEGTLAVFADQNLLFTTELRAGTAEPVHLDQSLTPGPHQLRVALYRPDKSLVAQKEGLTDLRAQSPNTLGIRINHHKKLFLKREDSLEVIWPSAPAALSAQRPAAPFPAGAYSLK
jgi:hypothetical protein